MEFRLPVLGARAIAFVAIVACVPVRSLAATDLGPGVISAFIRDSNGKPVQGALVIAAGPTVREATTTIAGIVTLLALPIGTYDVSVTHAGFATARRHILVSSDPAASVLRLSIVRTTFAQAQGVASGIASISLTDDTDTLAAHVVSTAADARLASMHGTRSGVAATSLGTSAFETRVELDGIPIAGGGTSPAALQFRTTLGLDSIAIEPGPVVDTTTLRGAIGGIIDYRTADFATLPATSAAIGYSSTFGSFQHIAATRSFGPLGIVASVVTGGGETRTQTLKARYAFSRATSFGVASYGLQSAATFLGANASTNAPAYAADLRTSLGAAAVQVRAFTSSVRSSSVSPAAIAASDRFDRASGMQARIDIPAGQDAMSLSFDRRSEYAAYLQTGVGHTIAQTFTSAAARAELHLSRVARLEIGDAYSGGTSLAQRNDPMLALSVRPTDRLTIRAAFGSSFATAATDVVLAQQPGAQAFAPETSFGYRIGIDDDLNGVDHVGASLFDLRRFDRFASYANARTFGVDLDFAHRPLVGFGGDAYLTLRRANAFGAPQPRVRIVDVLSRSSLTALEGDPYYTLHSQLSYRAKRGVSFGIASTLSGANNALGPHALGFVDASSTVPVAGLGEVLLGENNIFGTAVSDPLLGPYYVPREFTILFRVGMLPEKR